MAGRSSYICLRCGDESIGVRKYSEHLGRCHAAPSIERIFEHLGVVPTDDGCWEHDRRVKSRRFVPKITLYPGTTTPAHLVVAELSHGFCPPGKQVNHWCDNRRCLRPEHLYYGTQSENTVDAWRNGRRQMTTDQLEAMQEGLRNSPAHKARMIEHNRALADKNRADNHWTRQSNEAMDKWKAAISAGRKRSAQGRGGR